MKGKRQTRTALFLRPGTSHMETQLSETRGTRKVYPEFLFLCLSIFNFCECSFVLIGLRSMDTTLPKCETNLPLKDKYNKWSHGNIIIKAQTWHELLRQHHCKSTNLTCCHSNIIVMLYIMTKIMHVYRLVVVAEWSSELFFNPNIVGSILLGNRLFSPFGVHISYCLKNGLSETERQWI